MLAFHEDHSAALTIGFVFHKYQCPFGVLELADGEVTGIKEKPTYVNPASAGIYCLSPDAVSIVRDQTLLTMPELAMQIREGGGKVMGYEIKEFWRALETRAGYQEYWTEEKVLPRYLAVVRNAASRKGNQRVEEAIGTGEDRPLVSAWFPGSG